MDNFLDFFDQVFDKFFGLLTFFKSIQTLRALGLEYLGFFFRLLQLEKLVKIRLYLAVWAVSIPYFLGLSTLKRQVRLKSSLKTSQINRDYEKNTHFEVFKLQLADLKSCHFSQETRTRLILVSIGEIQINLQ